MDALNLATEWAKAEATTAAFFIGFGLLFIASSIGFWRLGKTKIARAYIFPTLIAGILLLLLGGALFDMYHSLVDGLSQKYHEDPTAFVASEIIRTNKAIKQYSMDLYGVFPYVIMLAALLMLVVKRKIWRAIFITIIALSTVLLLVDSNAISLLEQYNSSLKQI